MPEKIGVYIDEPSLGKLLKADELAEYVKNTFGGLTPVVKSHPRLNSEEGRKLIQADIDEGSVDAVCICGPSPRYDWEIFQFDGVLMDRVNMRELCSMCYQNPDGSLPEGDEAPEELKVMAQDYIKMGVTKLSKSAQPEPEIPEITKTIMVLGGGWTGLSAALYAAGCGYDVIIVEKDDKLGGKALNMYKSFALKPPYSETTDTGIEQKVAAVESNPKIKVYTSTSLEVLEGAPGLYKATLKTPGGSEEVPVGSMILATGWVEQDKEFLGPLGYGSLKNMVTSKEFEAMAANGGIKRADGSAPRTVAFIAEHDPLTRKVKWGTLEDKLAEPEDEPEPEPAEEEGEEEAFVYEDLESAKHIAYSSELTSLVALKQANYVADMVDGGIGVVIYNHMMVPGINERYYKAAQDNPGVMLTKGLVSSITQDADGGLLIKAGGTLLGEDVEIKADMVVLPTGMVPVTAHEPTLNLKYRQGPAFPDMELFDGFADSNYICFPYETRRTGIYAAGCVRQPMTMATAEEDAAGAALKAIQCLVSANRGVSVHPRSGDLTFPVFNFVRCTQCKRCTEECPFGALDDDPKGTPMPNPTRCRRCGTCMGACPERVIGFANYNVDQIGSMIKQVEVPPKIDEGGPRAIVLACENDAYPALDMAAMRGKRWSPYVRFIPVRCLGSVNTIWIADAMSKGVDGVMLLGCKYGEDYQCHFVKGSELCNRRMDNVAESLNRLGVEPERVKQTQVAIDEYDKIPDMIDEFMDYILKIGPNPFKGY